MIRRVSKPIGIILCFMLFLSLLIAPTRTVTAADPDIGFAGSKLTGNALNLYIALRKCIHEIATGQRYDTEYVLDHFDVDKDTVDAVTDALESDCPYELFWFEGRLQYIIDDWFEDDGLPHSYFAFPVSEAYSVGEVGDPLDPDKLPYAWSVADNAAAIAKKHASESDIGKLISFRDEISALVSYNSEAAADMENADRNAWHAVWVFDGDDTTNVTCMGYARAFQYLCDLTDFDGDVQCFTVRGEVNGEGHMWNMVRMPDGQVYLMDITNYDGARPGTGDVYSMNGMTANGDGTYSPIGEPRARYRFYISAQTLFSAELQAIASEAYPLIPDVPKTGDAAKPEIWLSVLLIALAGLYTVRRAAKNRSVQG